MKNILLLAHDDPGQEARLQAALDLVRAFDGHLICVGVAEAPLLYGDPHYGAIAQSRLVAQEQEIAAANRARIEARLAREGIRWTWIEVTGAIATALEEHSKTADVIVVNRELETGALQNMRAIAGELIVGSGRAVVAVPEQSRGFRASGKALVAWNGSDEAMRAVRGSLPLLRTATEVTILEIGEGAGIDAEQAATYLARHGVKPAIVRGEKHEGSVADAIIAYADANDADYVVMGAFGRPRVVEAVFGGVTREMLGESPIPTVMVH